MDRQWQTKTYDEFLSQLEVDQRYHFRLTANPVVSRTAITDGLGRSKRIPHVTTLQVASWLVGAKAYEDAGVDAPDWVASHTGSRAERNGFAVVEDATSGLLLLSVSECEQRAFVRGANGKRITIATARFDGVLTVRNPALLRYALTHGIGHAKGFGCGLMTLVPLGLS